MINLLAEYQYYIALLLSLAILCVLLMPLISGAQWPHPHPDESCTVAAAEHQAQEQALLEDYLIQEQALLCGKISEAQWRNIQKDLQQRYLHLTDQRREEEKQL